MDVNIIHQRNDIIQRCHTVKQKVRIRIDRCARCRYSSLIMCTIGTIKSILCVLYVIMILKQYTTVSSFAASIKTSTAGRFSINSTIVHIVLMHCRPIDYGAGRSCARLNQHTRETKNDTGVVLYHTVL